MQRKIVKHIVIWSLSLCQSWRHMGGMHWALDGVGSQLNFSVRGSSRQYGLNSRMNGLKKWSEPFGGFPRMPSRWPCHCTDWAVQAAYAATLVTIFHIPVLCPAVSRFTAVITTSVWATGTLFSIGFLFHHIGFFWAYIHKSLGDILSACPMRSHQLTTDHLKIP